MFELFDPQGDVRITAGNLPHWYQPDVTYFVTFRTEDSLPNDVADLWHRRRDDWLRRHQVNPTNPRWKALFERLPREEQIEFHHKFTTEYLSLLDKGWGECVLMRRELASFVSNSLEHFDGQRYRLGDFIVMPNHVHLLVCLLGSTEIEKQCYSWKKFSAGKINSALGRQGRFWQEESFDHLVRGPNQFERFRDYIATNGERAGLDPGSYLVGHGKQSPK